jgi:hypothetical protein
VSDFMDNVVKGLFIPRKQPRKPVEVKISPEKPLFSAI